MNIDPAAFAAYKPYALKALAAYGGISAAFDFGIAKVLRPVVDAGMAIALKNPVSKMLLVKYEDQFLGAFDVARDEVKKTIDAAKAASAATAAGGSTDGPKVQPTADGGAKPQTDPAAAPAPK